MKCNCNFSNEPTLALDMFKILKKDIKKYKRIIAIETALILFFMGVIGMFMFKYCYHDPNNPQIQKTKTNYVQVVNGKKKKGVMWVEKYNI